jgi:amidase
MNDDLCYISATEAIARFKARELSPVELMQAIVARAEKVEPQVNAFTDDKYYEQALAQAKEAERRYMGVGGEPRPLEGIAVAIKDEYEIKGQRTTNGCSLYENNISKYTTLCIERIMDAGAIVHARTTTPQFSMLAVTHSPLWGVTRNPWNLDYTCGGSTGGSAAALAAGTATLAPGWDMGGSIRIPSSCSGVVGFKAPYGRIPDDYPENYDSHIANGSMARTVSDCLLLENIMAGPDPQDIISIRPKLTLPSTPEDIRSWKIAYSFDLGYCEVDPEVIENTKAALDVFRSLGCTVEEVKLGWSWKTLEASYSHMRHSAGNVLAEIIGDERDALAPYVRDYLDDAKEATPQDNLRSNEIASEMYETLGPILDQYNVFICPTTALAAVPAEFDPSKDKVQINGVEVEPYVGWVMTYPFNVMGRCPVISVPSGHVKNGVPTGIQIVGKTYDDTSVFRAAAAYEKARGHWYDTAEHRPLP